MKRKRWIPLLSAAAALTLGTGACAAAPGAGQVKEPVESQMESESPPGTEKVLTNIDDRKTWCEFPKRPGLSLTAMIQYLWMPPMSGTVT